MTPAQIEEQLLAALKANGLRLTLPRRVICRVLAEANEGFLTVKDITERVAEGGAPMDTSTVYRTLNELQNIGYAHYVPIGKQSWAWHPTVDHDHHHLICEGCGRSYTVPVQEFAPAFDGIKAKYGFTPASHHFAIVGLCAACDWSDTGRVGAPAG